MIRIISSFGFGIFAGTLFLAGCSHAHHGRRKHSAPPPPPPATEPSTMPATEPASAEPAPPEMLQQKTQSYAQSLQQLMSTTQTAEPATQPEARSPSAAAPPPPAPLESLPPAPPPAVDVSVGSPTANATSQPNGAAGDGLLPLTQRIDQRAHDYPRDPAAQLDGQLLEFLKGQSVPDEGEISQVPQPDRDVIAALMDGLSNYRDVLRNDPTATTTRKLQPLMDMDDRFHAAADLRIPAIAFCSAVRGFGDYQAMDSSNLPTGQSIQAIVYCQVANFASQLEGQMWEIKLNEQVSVYSQASGKSVWTSPKKPIVDRCRQRRHDCYCIDMIALPPDLAAGKYILTATIEDQIANKLTQGTMELTVK